MSTTKLDDPPNEFDEIRSGSVSVAGLLPKSKIVPPFRANEVVAA